MRGLNQFLREARAMGLTGPGRAVAGLPDDVVLHPSDQIRRVSADEEGRALPGVVVEQLLAPDALEPLAAASGADVRAMVELQALIGRRTGELCGLRWDCLAADEMVDQGGQVRPAPVLIHDMPKAAVRRYHLPIGNDRSTITPYSFRHTYAQRQADAGTPVEVLAALMGHRKLTTTQGYYRVGQERKRAAVDLLAALQVDHAGGRTRPTVERLLDAEHLRETIGQVAVPFGICREPANVKAHGQACPFRHQCFGCTHFHSDPSYLPELRGYLSRLLADRERLRAAVPGLEDWARNGAIPSGEEIAAVPVRFLGVVGQPSPTLFPNVRREQEPADDV